MAVTKAVAANPVKKDASTIVYGGATRSNVNSIGMTTVGYHSGLSGSRVPNPSSDAQISAGTDTSPTYKPNSGTFANMMKGQYIMQRNMAYLAGVANTKLQSGAGDFGQRRSINKIRLIPISTLTGLSWSVTQDGEPVYTATYTNANVDVGSDDAASPTRSIPGELTYQLGSNTPYNADYKAKTD